MGKIACFLKNDCLSSEYDDSIKSRMTARRILFKDKLTFLEINGRTEILVTIL